MTFTPTYETLVLTNRIEKGDVLAIKDLWEHLFPDAEFDPTRPIKDVSDEIAAVLDEYSNNAAKKSAKDKTNVTSDIERLFTEAEEIVDLIFNRQSKKSK